MLVWLSRNSVNFTFQFTRDGKGFESLEIFGFGTLKVLEKCLDLDLKKLYEP